MEIRIISREIIKPCSSTPDHLRSFKLSAMDQFSLHATFPFIFFYSGACKNTLHLKKSLSQTLTYYYPFAGRLKNGFSVDCDDYGVPFIEASVAGDMSELIKQPKIELLEQLRPYNEEEMLSSQVTLAVQVNHFDGGGVAICVYFRHAIADGCAAAHFVRNWSKVANCGGSLIDKKDVIFDCTSIFPSQDVTGAFSKRNRELANDHEMNTIIKWFVFNNSKIAALQEKIGDKPTRFQALLALMWGAMIDANIKEYNNNIPTPTLQFGAIIPVNLRRKLNPALPEQCIGNPITIGMTAWPTKEVRANYNKIVFKAREMMSMVDEYVKNGFPNGWKTCIKNEAAIDGNTSEMKTFTFTSICRLPFYEADFGWGKPLWVTLGQRGTNNIFIPIDTSDGKGIEVLVALSEEDMAKFEQDPAILAYASSSK
ncbi:hypothetical protein QYF36_023946 [Acer negundo]|nr:hypothetical protein QYF36_023946 [Acer negundo]